MKRYHIIVLSLFLIVLAGCGSSTSTYQAEGAVNYDKEYIVQTYHGDLDSNLSLFPDELPVEEENNIRYEALLHSGMFDTDARIILYHKYNSDELENEKSRLKAK